jgi:hypothetical protein
MLNKISNKFKNKKSKLIMNKVKLMKHKFNKMEF